MAASLLLTCDVEGADVRVNGRAVGTTPLVGGLTLPAGSHFLRVSAPGKSPWSAALSLREGTSVTLHVPMDLDAAAVAPAGDGDAAAWTALTIGGIALGVGTALGILHLRSRAEFDAYDRHAAGATRRELDELEAAAASRGTAASMALGIGVASAAAGLVLWLWPFDGPPSPPAAQGPPTADGAESNP